MSWFCSLKSSTPKVVENIPTPKYTPPMPPIFKPNRKLIKTIVKHYTQSNEFDTEVNEAIKDGWTLDELKIKISDSFVILFALLHINKEQERKE